MTVVSHDFDSLFLGAAEAFSQGDIDRCRVIASQMMPDAAIEAGSPAAALVAKAILAGLDGYIGQNYVKGLHVGFGIRLTAEFERRYGVPQSFSGDPDVWIEFKVKLTGIQDNFVNRHFRPPYSNGYAIADAVDHARIALGRVEERRKILSESIGRRILFRFQG